MPKVTLWNYREYIFSKQRWKSLRVGKQYCTYRNIKTQSLDLQRLGLDTVETKWRIHQDVGIELKLIMFMFHFIQSIIAIFLVHWTENKEFQHAWKSSVEAGKYSIKMYVVTPCFFVCNNIIVEVHPGCNELCCGENRTGRFTVTEEEW